MNIRQTPQWGKYLASLGWQTQSINKTQVLIRKVPLLPFSLIKIQHPQNPVPIEEIDKLAKKSKALFTLIEPAPKDFDDSLLKKQGFNKSSISLTYTSTIEIDLKISEIKLFNSFSENAKRNIKKSQQSKLTTKVFFLKDLPGEEEFKTFFNLFTNLTKIKNFYAPSFEEYKSKMLALKNQSILLFAYHPQTGEPLASVWAAYFQDTIYYLNTGITKEGYKLLANYLLVWELLKVGQKLKLKTFDFEGIFDSRLPKERKTWKNFSEFKKRFHGQIVEYPMPYIKIYNPVFKLIYLCSQILP